jgi:Fuc2NAc and GlcNAc transferase
MIKTYLFFILSYFLTFLLTYFGVERFRQWSLRRKLFDIPNERSSHSVPTPRGGGLVIFLVCLTVFSAYCLIFEIEYFWVYALGALIVGLVSWLDDLYAVSVLWRFAAHSLAAILIIFNFGFWESAYIPFAGEIYFGKFGAGLTFFWIVWLINAYNFMDGIDGIAGVQAISGGIGWLFAGIILGAGGTAFYGIIIAVAALAFLFHNWQPAKIFMGDVGSAFLGYTFAVIPLLAVGEVPRTEIGLLPLLGILMVSAFVFDSFWTLCKRLARFEKIWQAHREHIYQKLVIAGLSHQKVAILYLSISFLTVALTIFWLYIGRKSGDFVFLLVIFQFLGLLFYKNRRKNLTSNA